MKPSKVKLPPVHELAEVFDLDQGEIGPLADRIKKHGLRKPIVRHEGKILAGRRRFLACQLAGVEPRFVEFSELPESERQGGILEYVMDDEFFRRHAAFADRALAAARYQEWLRQHPSDEKLGDVPEKFKVSARTVADAGVIVKNGHDELVDAVAKKRIPVAQAAEIARKPKDEQPKTLEEVFEKRRQEAAAKAEKDKPKPGQIAFDEKTIDDAYGKLLRAFQSRHIADGKPKSGPKFEVHRELERLMSQIYERITAWRRIK